jgi:gamma-glutamylcyclotransferase (GGCT)/AIG2-like uncharacterized protein YtfP
MGVQADGEGVLGKMFYFSLSNALIERGEMAQICESLNFPYAPSKRATNADAFRSATGDVYERVVTAGGIFKAYCRDNKRTEKGKIGRELVKETLNGSTNDYKKLANIVYDRETDAIEVYNGEYDWDVDTMKHLNRAQELFDLYKRCCSRGQIETMIENYIYNGLNALKISIKGKLFFAPKSHMDKLDLLEDFIDELNLHNKHDAPLRFNFMYVADDAKQREKMAAEFCVNVRREIEYCQERIQNLLSVDSKSAAICDRWTNRIQALLLKKKGYEDVLKRELDDLDEEFKNLQFLSQELQLRVNRKHYPLAS